MQCTLSNSNINSNILVWGQRTNEGCSGCLNILPGIRTDFCRAGEPEPQVIGPLKPEPFEKKIQGARTTRGKNQEPEPQKNYPAPQPCNSGLPKSTGYSKFKSSTNNG